MSETDAEEAKCRAEWLHKNNAPKNWIILTNSEISTIRAEFEVMERERDEARAKVERQAERIRQLEGATNHAGGLRG